VNGVISLAENVVRLQTPDNTYLYLNDKNDYAIKGDSGKNGDVKFKEYFTFLNPESFPNTNMCWRTVGVNPVKLLASNTNEEKSKDLTISVEETISSEAFFNDADLLATSIYSSLTK